MNSVLTEILSNPAARSTTTLTIVAADSAATFVPWSNVND